MVNIKEVAAYVAVNNGISKITAEAMVKDTFEFIKGELAAGYDVGIDKFGKFTSVFRAGREGRNPSTGEKMFIPSKTVMKFKPAKSLREEIL